ncbi:transcriptional regulator [Opitutaceae bacterium TAV1]|nr:transcriptional regulator [Opitutaceae bacterium TAV1]
MPPVASVERMPTTREIAAACGCSQTTVSFALNAHPKIPAATRTRVLAAARKLGWRPNAFASAYMAHLRTQRRPMFQATLAFLVSNRRSGRIRDQGMHMQRHFAGAKARAKELGYELEPVWLHEPGLAARRLNQVLRNRNIPGFIIPGIVHPSDIFEGIEWAYFVAVTMAWSLRFPMLNRVGVNTAHGFELMLRKAVELGYRCIGVVVSDQYDETEGYGVSFAALYARERWAAALHGVKILIYRFPRSHPDEIPGIQKWLRRNRPDAVLAEEVVWWAIERMGWRVPQDVAFISVDRAPEYPDIGGFNQRHELHGSVAIDLLVGQILQNERGLPAIPREVLVKGEWADGISVPPKAEIAALGKRSARL